MHEVGQYKLEPQNRNTTRAELTVSSLDRDLETEPKPKPDIEPKPKPI